MRKIEIELAGVKATAVLDEEGAPVTCGAFWEALPLQGEAIQAIWSGEAIVLTGVALGVYQVENHSTFMPPGTMVYTPLHEEVVISYGEAQFRYAVGPAFVTGLGRMESNLEEFCCVASRLLRQGAKPVVIRKA